MALMALFMLRVIVHVQGATSGMAGDGPDRGKD
ncbi:hypothetical protein EDD30_2052 [Couchioplanes caeruleus]|uniref:Uncharacterized protein n=1 Tax=Couchioplanes caeruleus TaxID=56438 RepID=A0A3N1GGB8_9ACTN|nr:hypothetical protein EDD30_2052 [Couchioplanes caeruleus]